MGRITRGPGIDLGFVAHDCLKTTGVDIIWKIFGPEVPRLGNFTDRNMAAWAVRLTLFQTYVFVPALKKMGSNIPDARR
jgi:hypothetical protein